LILDWFKKNKLYPEHVIPQDAVRLNLGCGDKKIDGYINVDIAPSRKGVAPDVISDIRKTAFSDNYADEVLSIHTIEHFYYWEVKTVILEWMRILKPGGRLILECPNLINAAREFIKNPKKTCGAGKEGQMTMWVFYGDPNWQDPLMCHKWGYTPHSLILLLTECGFVDVRQAPAMYKKKDPRDMRVTACKPRESYYAS